MKTRFLFFLPFFFLLLLASCSGGEKGDSGSAGAGNSTMEGLIFNFQSMIPKEKVMGAMAKTPEAIWDTTGSPKRTPAKYLYWIIYSLTDEIFDHPAYEAKYPGISESFNANYDPAKTARLFMDALPYFHFDQFNDKWKSEGKDWEAALKKLAGGN